MEFPERVNEALAVIGRLVLFALFALLVLFLSGVALKPFLPSGLPAGRDGRVLFSFLIAFALLVSHILTVAVADRGRWGLAGFGEGQWSPRWLVAGPTAGAMAVLMGALALLQAGLLTAVPSASADPTTFLLDAVTMVAVIAALEELAFRGYLFGLLEERWGFVVTIALSSAAFALFHARGPDATGSTLLAAFVMGIFLGVVRWRGGLPAAWLAQLGIGGMQAIGLHFPSRAVDLGPPASWRIVATGDDWLTGGAWGIEGGAAVAGGLTLVTFLLFRLTRSSGLSSSQ